MIRGAVPLDAAGKPISHTAYPDFRGALIDRLGGYCSYCEMKLDAGLAVEHMLPRQLYPQLETTWDNMLLACVNCNSTKGDEDLALVDYYWPDRDNTVRAFTYKQGGIVEVAAALTPAQHQIAERTMKLTGLDKRPGHNPAESDRRWSSRRETWEVATSAHQDLLDHGSVQMRATIVQLAVARGYWSVWMTVFADMPDMRQRFIDAQSGTCTACFDAQSGPIPRPGGAL